MQWIFMLVGLVLGWTLDESFYDAGMAALLGLGIGQAIRLSMLSSKADQQGRQLEIAQKALSAVEQRLAQLEKPARQPDPTPAPAARAVFVEAPVAESAKTPPTPQTKAPELVWELPPDLAPVAVAKQASQPLPDDVWASAPVPAPAPRAKEPAVPRGPNLIERALGGARNWLFGGNTVLRVGVVLLFLGLAFLLRYATEGMVVPIEVRYAGVAAAAVGLLGLGWWLRLRNSHYGLMLQGTGIAVLYLTVFAAMRLHPLIDPSAALGLLVAVTVFSAILAITQDALGLACAAALGGFAAPILTSTGSGNHVALFSYFALLNTGILAIAWFKAWRLLNLIGFVGTFGIGFAWGLRSYTPELLWSTEPFLVLFFLMYLAIGLLFARRKLLEMRDAPEDDSRGALLRWSAAKGDYVDGSMLFGPPLVGFGLQFALVQHLEFAAAFSALGLGIIYMGLARILSGGRALLLAETCLALGVIFASLAIPLGLDARWTAAAWAVEGAGIFWLGLRQQRPLARAFGLLLQLGSALAFLSELHRGEHTLLEGAPLGALLLGAALLFSFDQLRKASTEQAAECERKGLPVLASLGLSCLYLLAPLLLLTQGTAISWAVAGLVTLLIGLRIGSRTFLFTAFAVQLLGGALFLLRLKGGEGEAVFDAGWSGLLTASLIGLALIGGMLLAARDDRVRGDVRLLRGLSVVLLAGLVLINLAVLFVLPWASASGVWALSGLLIIWLSLYLQQRVSFVFGLLLQLIGGGSFLLSVSALLGPLSGEALRPLAHSGFWTPMVLGLAALVGAWRLQRQPHAPLFAALKLQRLSDLLLVWGAAWWTLAVSGEVLRFIPDELQGSVLLVTAALSVAIWSVCATRLRWASLGMLCTLLMPAAGMVLLVSAHTYYHPAAHYGWLAWLAVFAVHFVSLRRLAAVVPGKVLSIAHVLGCWMLIGVLALELRYGLLSLSSEYNAWRWLGWAILPSLYLVLAAAPRQWPWPWPVAVYPREYRVLAALPLAVLMLGWFWLANTFSDGTAKPLPYVPLLNPLDLGLLFALLGVYLLSRSVAPQRGPRAQLIAQGVAGVSLFAFFTALVMRTAHHWGGVPFQLDALLASMLVQASLSIVWTLIALGLMIGGHLRHRRDVWLIGAALIAVVVAKLFFVELSNRGGLARIVSFIGVGALLLVVGYFAPLPPKRAEPVLETEGATS